MSLTVPCSALAGVVPLTQLRRKSEGPGRKEKKESGRVKREGEPLDGRKRWADVLSATVDPILIDDSCYELLT